MHYWQFVENERRLQAALQDLAREERGDIPRKLQTPAERRKSADEVRAVERSVERFIERGRKYAKKVKHVSVGEY